METEERRRRSGGSAKTSKNGGKRTKALIAEEEERRREEVREKLRGKLELEKRARKVVERLLEDSVAEDFLVDCAKFITPANYKDMIEERFIAKLCGYPICPNKLGKIPTQRYKISTKTNKVYDITERKCFCSNFCYKASKEFELQISTTPLWLRNHESPPEIKLLKNGESGSSGEEVVLLEWRLKEDDIEDPLAIQSLDLHSSQQSSAAADHSDISDTEQEQDFVTSVVSQQQKPRVHWGDLPKRTDEDKKGMTERRKKQPAKGNEEESKPNQSPNVEERQIREDEERKVSGETDIRGDAEKPKQLHRVNADQEGPEEKDLPKEPSVEEATTKLNMCSLSHEGTRNTPARESSLSTESKQLPLSATEQNNNTASPNQPGLNITQVGMSKRGAAGLKDLLKSQTYDIKPDSMRLNLLQYLRRTLKEWCTDETLKFLYGADYSLGCPSADGKEEYEEKEEELDEDDLEDDVTAADEEEQKRPSAAAPDYERLRKEAQQMELRIKEFYKGTWILPEEEEEQNGNNVTVEDRSLKDPVLPLIDSHSQHLIQKRITVEKLTSCLRSIIGPLRLTMSDVSADLNNLVRTFRFTNTNIIHKTPEWTLISVVLLHLVSEVSLVVREALETSTSVEYLNTLMRELGLQEQDLLNLVQLFKTPTH